MHPNGEINKDTVHRVFGLFDTDSNGHIDQSEPMFPARLSTTRGISLRMAPNLGCSVRHDELWALCIVLRPGSRCHIAFVVMPVHGCCRLGACGWSGHCTQAQQTAANSVPFLGQIRICPRCCEPWCLLCMLWPCTRPMSNSRVKCHPQPGRPWQPAGHPAYALTLNALAPIISHAPEPLLARIDPHPRWPALMLGLAVQPSSGRCSWACRWARATAGAWRRTSTTGCPASTTTTAVGHSARRL